MDHKVLQWITFVKIQFKTNLLAQSCYLIQFQAVLRIGNFFIPDPGLNNDKEEEEGNIVVLPIL